MALGRRRTHTFTVASVVNSPFGSSSVITRMLSTRKKRLLPTARAAHQQLERRVGGLEVEALVLEPLQVVDHLVDGGAVHRQPELLGLHLDRRPAGHLADDEARAVADELRVDVLVGVLGPDDRADVQAGLVGERRGADVRRLRVERPVEHLGDVVADGGQPLEPALGQARAGRASAAGSGSPW